MEEQKELKQLYHLINKEQTKPSRYSCVRTISEQGKANISLGAQKRWADPEEHKRMSEIHKASTTKKNTTKEPKTNKRVVVASDALVSACRANAAKASDAIYADGQVYASKSEASRALGLDISTIFNRVKSPHFPEWYEIDRATYEQMAASA